LLGQGMGSALRQSDGSLILGGVGLKVGPGGDDAYALVPLVARIDSTLQRDMAFGNKSVVQAVNGPFDGWIYSLAAEANGKILAAGYAARAAGNGSVQDGSITRLLADGTVDDSFGTHGTILTDFSASGSDYSFALATLLRTANG